MTVWMTSQLLDWHDLTKHLFFFYACDSFLITGQFSGNYMGSFILDVLKSIMCCAKNQVAYQALVGQHQVFPQMV